MNGWPTGQNLEIIQHRGFQGFFFSQMKRVKTQHVKMHKSEADLVGSRAEVCGKWDRHLAGWPSSCPLRHLVESEGSDEYSQKLLK